jgi:hypothetical protein
VNAAVSGCDRTPSVFHSARADALLHQCVAPFSSTGHRQSLSSPVHQPRAWTTLSRLALRFPHLPTESSPVCSTSISPIQGASWPISAATRLASAPRLAARGGERGWAGPNDATERTRATLISGPAPSLDRGEDRSSKRGDLPQPASRRGNESHNSATRSPSDTANRADLGTHVAPREVARPSCALLWVDCRRHAGKAIPCPHQREEEISWSRRSR